MRPTRKNCGSLALATLLCAACASDPNKVTLSELESVSPDLTDVSIDDGLDQAMAAYRRFLETAPESELTPEAMRRLADLKLEKEYGFVAGAGETALPAPQASTALDAAAERSTSVPSPAATADAREDAYSDFNRDLNRDFNRDFDRDLDRDLDRDVPEQREVWTSYEEDGDLPQLELAEENGPRAAIELYDRILATYPNYEHNDRVLYQKARAFDELGEPDAAIAVTEQLIERFPHSQRIDEVYFRRAEYFFTRRRYLDAEDAYSAITRQGATSSFYELALYKLGWTFYKQELHEEALGQYIALLDHKVATGYDFDQQYNEESSRRISDTFRVVSLSFSSIGGPAEVTNYFAINGSKLYEDRVYRHLGEFYLEKLRYQDAADSYEAFVALHPTHRSAPYFGVRVVEIYEAGGFPQLVLAAKKDFANRYALGAEYWQHFPIEEAEEVVAYLKTNLRDLANHYHAAYQEPENAKTSDALFAEAERWYRTSLTSFPEDAEAPAIHHRLADLLLEHKDYGLAATEYENTAYDYSGNERAAEAGYAAIYAHREHETSAAPQDRPVVREAAVTSTLRFVDAFPAHEHAAVVLGRAVDDLYEMERYEAAIEHGRRLLDDYPDASAPIIRSAWLAIAHSAFSLSDYPQAELAYVEVLDRTPEDDKTRQDVIETLAAAIYKQGELASNETDYRAAADHFLRIAEVAPASEVAPAAQFDGGAALIRLEDWDGAVRVLDSFRDTYPEHELRGEATKQLASVYKTQGELELAASEYERIALEAEDDELRREAQLTAAELYEDAAVLDRAIAAYEAYLDRYPEPLDLAVETHFKLAELHGQTGDESRRHEELRWIVATHRRLGADTTDRIRYLAARSSLVLTEGLFDRFAEVELTQPFDKSLAEKQRRMDAALNGFGRLVDFEVAEVTAAATFYMAEIYRDFSRALMDSERPGDLSSAELMDYELVLEEEAYPFEEKAIDVHEKNLELMDAGVYNRWIEKSLVRLGGLMPGRYAKFEESSGLLHSVERYAYDAPQAPAATEPGESSEADADAPSVLSDPAQTADAQVPDAPVEEPPPDAPASPSPSAMEY